MKITETAERECCEPRDLLRVVCEDRVYYCMYCGKRWHRVEVPGPSSHEFGWNWEPLP